MRGEGPVSKVRARESRGPAGSSFQSITGELASVWAGKGLISERGGVSYLAGRRWGSAQPRRREAQPGGEGQWTSWRKAGCGVRRPARVPALLNASKQAQLGRVQGRMWTWWGEVEASLARLGNQQLQKSLRADHVSDYLSRLKQKKLQERHQPNRAPHLGHP